MPMPVPISASQIKTFRSCPKAWAYDKLDRVERRESGAAAAGTAIHAEVENYYLHGTAPTRCESLALLAHLPTRFKRPRIEEPVSFLFPYQPRAWVRGFIDLRHGPNVYDHKTVAVIKAGRHLDVDTLPVDEQGVLYGFHTRLMERMPNSEDVILQWNYVQRESTKVKPIRARQSLTVLDNALRDMTSTVNQIVDAVTQKGTARDFVGNPNHCFKYGKCQYAEFCPDFVGKTSEPTVREETPMNADLLAQLRAASASLSTAKVPEPPTPPPAPQTVAPAQASDHPDPTLPSIADLGGVIDDSVRVAVVPPDAAPNVTPSDPPPPELVQVKRGRGRPPKSATSTPTTPTPATEAVITHVSFTDGFALLEQAASVFATERNFEAASEVYAVLARIGGGK